MNKPDTEKFEDRTVGQFFGYMSERHKIWRRRQGGGDKPWTEDEILQKYKFCNVFRELDPGTQFVTRNIFGNRRKKDILFNIILYRFFNKPETFNKLLCVSEKCRKRGFFITVDFPAKSLAQFAENIDKPFSPAYRVQPGRKYDSKLENVILGVLRDDVIENIDEYVNDIFEADSASDSFHTICNIKGCGPFLAYQIYLDLTYTDFYPFDENDYMHVGPGAETGIDMMFDKSDEQSYAWYVDWLRGSADRYFRDNDIEMPSLSLKEIEYDSLTRGDIEFNLCEYRKYCQAKNNEGRVRKFQ